MKTSGQRDLLIDQNIRDAFIDEIDKIKDELGIFSEKTDIYLMSAIFGFINKVHSASKKKVSIRQIHELNEDQELIIYTLGYAEKKSVDLLKPDPESGKELFKLIEEYANSGAPLLHEMVMHRSDNSKNFEEIVWDKIKEIHEIKKT